MLSENNLAVLKFLWTEQPLEPAMDAVQLDRVIEELTDLGLVAYLAVGPGSASLVLTLDGLNYCERTFGKVERV